jgi:hypothetical protein
MMMKKAATVNDILEEYKNAAIKYCSALQVGDHKTANKQYAVLKKIYMKLQKDDLLAGKVLDSLLTHKDVRLRIPAAAHSLGLKRNIVKAEKALEETSHMKDIGVLQMDSEMALRIWKAQGYLKF